MAGADKIDDDIAAMKLDEGEKWGLQVYRNYSRAFEARAISEFVNTINKEELDTKPLESLCELISVEDARFLPVIVCSYVDGLLEKSFKKMIPSGVPGGKDKLFSGYGPLSDFSKRIKLAYAFNVISKDLLNNVDVLRGIRNDLSHKWDIRQLRNFFEDKKVEDFHPIEADLAADSRVRDIFSQGTTSEVRFRIRLSWIAARVTYECAAYNRAKAVNVNPRKALYDPKNKQKWLAKVGEIALRYTHEMMERHNRSVASFDANDLS